MILLPIWLKLKMCNRCLVWIQKTRNHVIVPDSKDILSLIQTPLVHLVQVWYGHI